MKRRRSGYGQAGSMAAIIIIALLVVALIATTGFAYSTYNSRQDYKNDAGRKISSAVDAALAAQKTKLQNQFAEQSKSPLITFNGPVTYGSVSFNYPRTWNGYSDLSDTSNPVKVLFYNGIVPASGVAYALKVELINDDYSTTVDSFDTAVQDGSVKASAYVPPKMVNVRNVQTGLRLDGKIEENVQGSMVIAKVRDKTLKIYTESPSFLNDFNNTILASLTFVP